MNITNEKREYEENKKHYRITRAVFLVSLILLLSALSLHAQDFGFGFDDEDSGGTTFNIGGVLAVSIGGEVSASLTGFFDDFSGGVEQTRLGDVFAGKLNFSAESPYAAGIVNLKLSPTVSPVAIDEGYVRAYFGDFEVEGGLRKLTWGKADSMGPLDTINPLDLSDLSGLSDPGNLKITRPLVHVSLRTGQFSKLEGVFVPTFEPLRFAGAGRWAPAQFAALNQLPAGNVIRPNTDTINYARAGLRFTTTINSAADIGMQYYYGRLTSPAVTMGSSVPVLSFAYNPYHQIGLDWAQVIAGFNLRAEIAANITDDLSGDDRGVYNPSFAWSLGFDRDLFAGINLNLQCNESIRLLDNKITKADDIEAGSDITSTRFTASLSKKFLRDELELKAVALWDIESKASLIMPGLVWAKNDVEVELAAGVFVGSDKGLFGQSHDNSFIKGTSKNLG